MIQRMRELDAAARRPGMIPAAHLERRIGGQQLAGFGDPRVARPDQPRQHQRLRARAALGEPAREQELIDPLLAGGARSGGERRYWRGCHAWFQGCRERRVIP